MGPLIYPFQIPEDIDQRALLREWLGIIVPSITIFTILTRYVLKAEQCLHHLNQKSGKLQITGGRYNCCASPGWGLFGHFSKARRAYSHWYRLAFCWRFFQRGIRCHSGFEPPRIWTPSRRFGPPHTKMLLFSENRMSHASDAWSQFFYELCVADRAI